MIYHAAHTTPQLDAVFGLAMEDPKQPSDWPDVKAVCGLIVPATEIIIVENANAYIPLIDLVPVPRTREEMPAVCLSCAMMMFSLVNTIPGEDDQTVVMMFGIGFVERERESPAE